MLLSIYVHFLSMHSYHLLTESHFFNYKTVLNFIQQVFFLLSTEGSLVISRAY